MRAWIIADLADAVEAGLRRRIGELDLEQAVYGLDSLDELRLHRILAEALQEGGFGVFREQRYPADRKRRRFSEGERCDLVLTPGGRPLEQPDAAGTLFDAPDAVTLADAFWLEVKIVAQFTVEGPNPNYSSQLLSTIRHDITKLSKDPGILHAGLLIVMFVRDHAVARHDLGIWQSRCVERGQPISAPSQRELPISDRIGNGLCVVSLYPVSHL